MMTTKQIDDGTIETMIWILENSSPGSVDEADGAIFEACRDGSAVEMQRLIAAHPAPATLFKDGALLTTAGNSDLESTEKVRAILKAGANPNLRDWIGWTALAVAAACNSPEIIHLLIQAGAAVNSQVNPQRWSALINASCAGSVDAARVLLKNGADPFLRSIDGLNAIAIAKANGQTGVLRAILAALQAEAA